QGPEAFRRIGSHTTTDLRYGYSFRGETGPIVSVGAINLFDRDPPHVHTNGGYDSKVHDPRGRVLYARASVRFYRGISARRARAALGRSSRRDGSRDWNSSEVSTS